jgi:hypothetical protein
VGDAGRLDGPDLLELHLRVPEVVEEASTVAEQKEQSCRSQPVRDEHCQQKALDSGSVMIGS